MREFLSVKAEEEQTEEPHSALVSLTLKNMWSTLDKEEKRRTWESQTDYNSNSVQEKKKIFLEAYLSSDGLTASNWYTLKAVMQKGLNMSWVKFHSNTSHCLLRKLDWIWSQHCSKHRGCSALSVRLFKLQRTRSEAILPTGSEY